MKKTIFKLVLFICLLNVLTAYAQSLVKYNANGKTGMKNKSGVIVVPAKYDVIENFNEGIAKVKIGHKYGAINQNGKEIIPVGFKYLGKCSEGMIAYKDDHSDGYLNTIGEVVFSYEQAEGRVFSVRDFSDGLAILEARIGISEYAFETLFFCINKQGEMLFEFDEDVRDVKSFSEGYSAVRFSNYKYGYVNKKGQLVISNKWDDAESFKNGKAKVMLKEKNSNYNNDLDDYGYDEYVYTYYYINKNGNIIEKIQK